MKYGKSASALSLALALSTLAAAAAPTPSGATITMAQAKAIALHELPGGKITDSELEKERGGSGLRYSFDVKYRGKTWEVGVDAKTGKVLEKAVEGANPD
ncbi:MAG TPA: PepSY domain-containing protein [Candidatus Baltobacteraceae bacterium]|nr:PepSY domain-containing protein [Candidatus Baltobacteraceae bacterium]